jgi:hypothetical protein
MEDLVRSAVYNNAGGTKQDRTYNAEATKMAAAQGGINYKEDRAKLAQEKWEQAPENRKQLIAIQSAERQVESLQKQITELGKNSGDALNEKRIGILQAQLDAANKFLGEQGGYSYNSSVDAGASKSQSGGNTPQPMTPERQKQLASILTK